jgi:glycosyltransferase involved in cell wall biosynthesis
MKLLLYSHSFAPNVGGVESIVLSLARGLAELRTIDDRPRFELTMVTETPAGDAGTQSLPFAVIRQPSAITLWRLIEAADLVHLAGPALLPLVLAWLARKPVAIEHHGYQAVCPNGLLLYQPDGSMCPGYFQARRYDKCVRCQAAEKPKLRAFVKVMGMLPRNVLAKSSACNIAVSRHVAERLKLPRSRVVYHGIETGNEFDQPAPETTVSPQAICFAYVGRLVQEKGLPVLLQAVDILRREHQDFRVLLIGDGPQRALLEATIGRCRLGDCIRITGFLHGRKFAETLDQVQVVVMPSIWEETAGLAVMEHMMRGRLVIASKIGGLLETIGDAGLMFIPGDAEDLVRCMRAVLRDPAIALRLGRKGRERAKSLFRRERMIAEHADIYQELSGQHT